MNKAKKLSNLLSHTAMIGCIAFNLLFCIFSVQASVATSVVEEVDEDVAASTAVRPIMPFKLGFEFQEVNGLCGWALNDSRLQKKPIFTVQDPTGHKLWHLELDTNDIEFVTEPFSYKQRPLLEQCTATIHQSFAKLVEMLNQQEEGVSFAQWLSVIQSTLGRRYNILVNDEMMSKVAQRTLQKPSEDWAPKFSPQATIQHPLEFTIPLYFNLLGFDNPSYTLPFSASLPGVEFLKTAMREGDSAMFDKVISTYANHKLSGFIFLHALTLISMTPIKVDTDQDILRETLDFLTKSHQVDVKSRLTLMSRRPFSLMWQDIQSTVNGVDYHDFFLKMMGANRSFTEWNVPELLEKTNYAEQFFDPSTGQALDCRGLIPNLAEEFYTTNQEVLNSLTHHGVVSTIMIRNFKRDIKFVSSRSMMSTSSGPVVVQQSQPVKDTFNKYFSEALASVESPERRCFLDLNTMEVASSPFAYDVLSPPFFLDLENSMGRYKHEISRENEQYGEAIVEIRAIRDVAPRFFKKVRVQGATPKIGTFLTDPSQIENQSLLLFRFLFEFSNENVRDFSVGLSYTLGNKGLH